MERIKLEHQNTMNKVDNFNNPYDKSNFDDNKDNIPDNGIPSDVPNINIGVLGDGDEDE
jgi:hypothetical protein